MKTMQVTYGIQRSANRSTEKYAYDKAEVTILLEDGDTPTTAFEAARAQCEAAIVRAESGALDAKLKMVTSTERGRIALHRFLDSIA